METKKQTENLLMLNAIIPQGMQKVTKKWKEPSFSKTLSLAFDKF